MLSHSQTTTHTTIPGSFYAQHNERTWSAIESVLRKRRTATAKQIAADIGVSHARANARLRELRELGEVRLGEPHGRSTIRTWTLGTEDYVAHAEQMKPTITPATQLGTFQRDPLVAALFGAGMPRCVGCHQLQGVPHEEGCAFDGINIDTIHQRESA